MKRMQQAGISLVEIMVTLAIFSILATLAVPSLQTMVERNQLQAFTNNMVSNLYYARSEAAKRSFNVVLCASDASQEQCDSDADSFNNGWIIFIDYDNDNMLTDSATLFDTDGNGITDSPEQILAVSEAPNSRFSVKSNGTPANAISYRPTGVTSPRLFSITVSTADESKELSRIYFNNTGRVRSCMVPTGESGC